MTRCLARVKATKNTCCRLNFILGKTPPRAVIQSDKNDGVILKALALVDRHQWNCVDAFVHVEGVGPVRTV